VRTIPLFAILSIFIPCLFGTAQAADPVGHPQTVTRSTANLKPFMAKFGSMIASLEIIKLKEKKPDWEAIDISVKEMSQTLTDLQKADQDKAYQEYTDVLAAGMVELKEKSAKRDKSFFNSLDKMTDSCFKCHAAHRPGDY